MLEPSIDILLKKVGSKFELAIIAAKRARQLQLHPESFKLEDSKQKDTYIGEALEELEADLVNFHHSM